MTPTTPTAAAATAATAPATTRGPIRSLDLVGTLSLRRRRARAAPVAAAALSAAVDLGGGPAGAVAGIAFTGETVFATVGLDGRFGAGFTAGLTAGFTVGFAAALVAVFATVARFRILAGRDFRLAAGS